MGEFGSKRASLRQSFVEKDKEMNMAKQHAEHIARLNSLEKTLTEAVNYLAQFIKKTTINVEVLNQLKEISTPDVDKVVNAVSKLDEDLLKKQPEYKPILTLLSAIQKELAQIPKEQAKFEQKDSFKVDNLDEISFDTTNLEKTIKEELKKLQDNQKAPVVNVDAPKMDTKPLEKLFKGILDAVVANKPEKLPESFKIANLDEIQPTDTSKIEGKLDEGNKLLKKISERPMGGGGGGNATPYTDSEGKPKYVELNDDGTIPTSSTDTQKLRDLIMGGPAEVSGYNYIGYKKLDGTYFIKRQNLNTFLWGYSYFASDFAGNWTNKASLTYGEPQ